MDTRLSTTRVTWLLLLAAVVALALVMALGATSASAGSPTDCRVRNTDTGETYTALQAAVDTASAGHRLTVEGTCHGTTVIGKDLVISGIGTETSGQPTLDGDRLDSVVTVVRVVVTLEDLTIEHGGSSLSGRNGGGLANRMGTVTLRDVIVRDNSGRPPGGGGILNTGRLTLAGASRVSDRVYNRGTLTMNGASSISQSGSVGLDLRGGTLTMNDRSSIRDNGKSGVRAWGGTIVMNDRSSIRGHRHGGGVRLYDASLTMNDSSIIKGNRALMEGGAVAMDEGSALTMNDSATITANAADLGSSSHDFHGGGVYSYRGGTLVGVTCGPGGNVYGNTPDDCYIEP
jgi:hypothetical protein